MSADRTLAERQQEIEAAALAHNGKRKPKFGDSMRNPWASESNPQRDGYFVRARRITGRLNPGLWYEMTDGNGKFWEANGKAAMFREASDPAPQVALTDALPDVKAACYRVDWSSKEPAGAMLMAAMKEEIAELRALLEARNQQGDAVDAERYRFLRDEMCFTTEHGQTPTMAWAGMPAPEHEPHKDWIGDRFAASVDRTIDAAIEQRKADKKGGSDALDGR